MFEDSTFESMSRIRTRSRDWMFATFAFNSSILLVLVVIPLIYPHALPQIASAILMEAPVKEANPVVRPEHAQPAPTQMPAGVLLAPSRIPDKPWIPAAPEPPMPGDVVSLDNGMNGAGSTDNPFSGRSAHPDVRPVAVPAQRVSSGIMAGMLIRKILPDYPAVPRAMHLEGTVVLEATISRTGTIENLRVVSGPALLQQAALNAVQQWRYRPYLLNGEPVEVETTVNVQFTLQ